MTHLNNDLSMREEFILHREIIKRMLTSVGAAPNAFGKLGITLPEFKTNKKLIIHYDDGEEKKFPLWSGFAIFPDSKMRALVANLTDLDVTEYALAFCLDNKPIYALRLTYDNIDFGDFLLQQGENFTFANTLVKALALVGIEMIIDQGISWQPSNEYDDLYQAISYLVEV